MPDVIDYRKLHNYHSINLKYLDDALAHIALTSKASIRRNDTKKVLIANRMYASILGAWAEVRLMKLLCDEGGFPNRIRAKVESSQTLFSKWQSCLDEAFCHKYTSTDIHNLPMTAKLRHQKISDYMQEHLETTITIRNKLAHGQWIYPLNNECTAVEGNSKAILQRHNIMSLQYKKSLLIAIASSIHDLVVSRPTFERDFDKHFKKITDIERDLSTRNYQEYERQLIKRYESGKNKRNENIR